jgi:hypothetical protein
MCLKSITQHIATKRFPHEAHECIAAKIFHAHEAGIASDAKLRLC